MTYEKAVGNAARYEEEVRGPLGVELLSCIIRYVNMQGLIFNVSLYDA